MHGIAKGKAAKDFYSVEEQERIRLAVEQAEARTSGEIAVMVVDRSDRYREAEVLGAVLVAGTCAVIAAVISGHITIWTYIPLTLLFYYPATHLCRRFPHLKMAFVNRWRVAEAVRERAIRAFYEKRLYRTRDETGVLIFISLLERKVWILGDRGINAKIAPHSWHRLAGELAKGIRENRSCDALCSVIAGCGDELHKHFPQRPDDINELSNQLIS